MSTKIDTRKTLKELPAALLKHFALIEKEQYLTSSLSDLLAIRHSHILLNSSWQDLSMGLLMEKENCEQILEIKDRNAVTIIKEFLKDGVKLQFNSQGETKGKYSAQHTETVDITQRIDGTNEWESRAIDMTSDGDLIMISGKGVGKMEGFQGEYTFMTMSSKLSWLNSTKAYAEGSSDMRSGEATIRVYAVKPMVEAASVM